MTLEDMFELFLKYKKEIREKNRFFVDPLYHKYFDRIIRDHTIVLKSGAHFFRARVNSHKDNEPYIDDDINLPPITIVSRAGRANPWGINYFYLANDEDTAIAEVRPELSKFVSVGVFELLADKKILLLDRSASIGGSIDEELDSMDVANFMMYLLLGFTTPVTAPDKELEYLPYQYFSEYCKRYGLDGIMYKSASIILESNHYCYVMFDNKDFSFIKSRFYRIDDIKYIRKEYFGE